MPSLIKKVWISFLERLFREAVHFASQFAFEIGRFILVDDASFCQFINHGTAVVGNWSAASFFSFHVFRSRIALRVVLP